MRDKISRCFENMQIAKKKFSMHYCKHGYWIDKTILFSWDMNKNLISKFTNELLSGRKLIQKMIEGLTKTTEFDTLW